MDAGYPRQGQSNHFNEQVFLKHGLRPPAEVQNFSRSTVQALGVVAPHEHKAFMDM